MLLLGNYDYFGTADAGMDVSEGWYVILGCGVVGGLLGGGFAQGLLMGTSLIAPLYAARPVHVAMVCGFLVALIGVVSGAGVYGTGYREAQSILHGQGHTDLLYPLWKLLATMISYLSGIPGGIFAPSLSTGAGLGAVLAEWFTSQPFTTVVLLGMVAYFSGMVQTPITAFVIVMEMTNNQDMIIPLMATSLIATGVSRSICPRPIYSAMVDGFVRTCSRS